MSLSFFLQTSVQIPKEQAWQVAEIKEILDRLRERVDERSKAKAIMKNHFANSCR